MVSCSIKKYLYCLGGYISWLVVCFFTMTTALGIYFHYSAVPFWDMWSGYLAFYYDAMHYGWPIWWEQHNEHRLVLSKIFFWIDLQWFQGRLIFLFIFNFLFSLFAAITFFVCLDRLLANKVQVRPVLLVIPFVLCFSWLQQENYVWAFQSQFHMAYLLPLWSFLLLSVFADSNKRLFFIASVILGGLSAFTMANGLLTLPLMMLMCVFLRLGKAYFFKLLILAIFIYGFYFHLFSSNYGVPVLVEGLLERLLVSISYSLRYLSGPFYQLFNGYPAAQAFAGVMFILLFLLNSLQIWDRRKVNLNAYSLHVALLAFVVFIMATTAMTALGRSQIGPAIPSRYMTPSLLGWCANLLVFLSLISSRISFRMALFGFSIVLTFVLLFPQTKSLDTHPYRVFVYKSAAVAAAMGINDEEVLSRVSYDHAELFRLIQGVREDGKSIFTQNYIQAIPEGDASELIRSPYICKYSLDKKVDLANSDKFVRVYGWVFSFAENSVPDYLYFVSDSKFVGYAITGELRTDVATKIHPQALYSGFQGYLKNDSGTASVSLYGVKNNGTVICSATL